MGSKGQGEKLSDVLSASGISRIVFIDDAFDCVSRRDAVSNSELLDSLCALDEDAIRLLEDEVWFDLLPLSLNESGTVDRDRTRSTIEALWPELDSRERSTIIEALGLPESRNQKSENDLECDDGEAFSIAKKIRSMAGAEVVFSIVSVADWLSYMEEKVLDDEATVTLVLLDQDLSNSSSCPPEYKTTCGGDLLVERIKSKFDAEGKADRILLIMLTNAVNDEGSEIRAMQDKFENGRCVSVMGKFRCENDEQIIRGIKLGLYIDFVADARTSALESFKSVDSVMRNFSDRFTLFELLAVAQNAFFEGIYPGEYYARVMAAEHMYNVVKGVRGSAAERAKTQFGEALNGFEMERELVEESKALEIEFANAYLSNDYLSDGRMPLDIGDVFEIMKENEDGSLSSSFYIVLAQQCGIAVRSKGTRKRHTISLAKLAICARYSSGGQRGRIKPEVGVLGGLPPFVDASSKLVADGIDHRDTISISDKILDLTVFSRDGVARYDREVGLRSGPVDAGWSARAQFLEKWANEKLEVWNELWGSEALGDNTMWKKYSHDFARSIWEVPIFTSLLVNEKGSCVEFGIKRVARLRSEYSYGVLVDYARYHSRPAFPGSLLWGKQ